MPVTLTTIAEVLVLSIINYAFIRHLQRTRGGGLIAGFTIVVIGALAIVLIAVKLFALPHISKIVDVALPGLVVALLIIFQPELRLAMTRLGEMRWVRFVDRLIGSEAPRPLARVADSIVNACRRMAKSRIGALIVVQRRYGILGYATGGIRVDGECSSALLQSIFYPNSPLHDGAVLVTGGRVMFAGCHLPLSESPEIPLALGTRHRAAIGMSEESDALVIVVSEETGQISVAEDGRLVRDLGLIALKKRITEGLAVQLETPEDEDEGDAPQESRLERTAAQPTVDVEGAGPESTGEAS